MLTFEDSENTIVDTFDKIESVEIIKDNNVTVLQDSEELEKIKTILANTFSDARLMPAFGVSIHKLTINEMKTGDWIKLNFSEELEKNGLPFTSLLFKVEDGYGVNLIREYNGKYDGRCLYIDFVNNTNLSSLID